MSLNPLPDSGTIAIIAPSSRGTPDDAGIKLLESRGFDVRVHAQNYMTDNQSAGSAAARAMTLMEVFGDERVDAIMAARGGNRAMHMLPLLDFKVIAANPKPFIAFSDGTALLNAFYAKTGLTGFHGPTLSRIAKAQAHELDQMIACLQGRESRVEMNSAHTINGGKARGPMIGGNLSVFAALCGTPYMPKPDGAILFLEDIGDQLSRYDRMLATLRLAGVLERAAGIVFGVMAAEGDSSVTPFGFSVADIIEEHVKNLGIPVMMNAPFGHSGPLPTFPVGGMAVLDADNKVLTTEEL